MTQKDELILTVAVALILGFLGLAANNFCQVAYRPTVSMYIEKGTIQEIHFPSCSTRTWPYPKYPAKVIKNGDKNWECTVEEILYQADPDRWIFQREVIVFDVAAGTNMTWEEFLESNQTTVLAY